MAHCLRGATRRDRGAAGYVFIARILGICIGAAQPAFAAGADGPALWGVPVDFILFGLTLLGVAFFHHYTLQVALTGLGVIVLYKLGFTGFKDGDGLRGLAVHMQHEWVLLTNLLCLLVGFALLSRHFEKSHVPAMLPRILPNDWKGAFWMLVIVFVLSGFLDNIAAAMIGGAMAHAVFRAKVHIGYLAAIVAAANAGGAGSVAGDTTTTMMWIDGVSPLDLAHAYVPAAVALIVFGIPASLQQQRYSPILRHEQEGIRIDWPRVGIVAFILVAAFMTAVIVNLWFPFVAARFPFIGTAVWTAILLSAPVRRADWEIVPAAVKGSIFLLALVTCASLMPVEKLPAAAWPTTFGLGFLSAVFDNIPLTALALKQGGYDWGMLAYAVGFGGSMVWFGSSAGVALSNIYPEAKSVGLWLKHGWHVVVAYVIGFFVLLLTMGWEPGEKRATQSVAPTAAAAPCTGG